MAARCCAERRDNALIEWIPTPESSRAEAIAYLPEEESILTRFPDGTEWRYDSCPAQVREEFTDPAASRAHTFANSSTVTRAARSGREGRRSTSEGGWTAPGRRTVAARPTAKLRLITSGTPISRRLDVGEPRAG